VHNLICAKHAKRQGWKVGPPENVWGRKVKIGKVDVEFCTVFINFCPQNVKVSLEDLGLTAHRDRGLAESLIVTNPVDTVGHTFHSRLPMQIEHKKKINE